MALARAAARERGSSIDGAKLKTSGVSPRPSDREEADPDPLRLARESRKDDIDPARAEGAGPALPVPVPAAELQPASEAALDEALHPHNGTADEPGLAQGNGPSPNIGRAMPGAGIDLDRAGDEPAGASAIAAAGSRARAARFAAEDAAQDAANPTATADPRGAAAASNGPDGSTRAAFVDALASAVARSGGPGSVDAPAGTPAAPSALPGGLADMARGSLAAAVGSTGPARELSIPTPVTAADFIPRLTGDLAVLARDGVQEARVNVHPVELGPIAVQITLEGNAAQVHLAADSAQTRDVLEQAMPALAAALRDSGLTLTGGGVFQQARQQPREPTQEAGAPGNSGTDDPAEAVDAGTGMPTSRRLRAVGALDVYA